MKYICSECDRVYHDGDVNLYERNNSGYFICECGGIIEEIDDNDPEADDSEDDDSEDD